MKLNNQQGHTPLHKTKKTMKLRINEAIALAESRGKKIYKKDLAKKIWPNSRPEAQTVNMTNLATGVTHKVNPDWVVTICKETGVSADFLFGLKED